MENDTLTTSEIKPGVGWIKAPRNPDALELIRANPNAFVLAYIIAYRARWTEGFHADGLTPGEAMLGDFENYGMSERQYRTAKEQLTKWHFATFKTTSKGTIGRLSDARLFNPLNVPTDEQNDGQPTDDRRTTDGQPTTNKELKKGRREEGKETDAGFESFWKAYPRKVAKAAALKKWKQLKATPELLEKMLTAIRGQSGSEQWRKDGGQFIPHPATWLSQGRWDDELRITTKPPVGGNF